MNLARRPEAAESSPIESEIEPRRFSIEFNKETIDANDDEGLPDRPRCSRSWRPPRPTRNSESSSTGPAATAGSSATRSRCPRTNVQTDGLNPHGTGSYLVVHETKFGDFVLDFDYKLTKGCNSGVFIRVERLERPGQHRHRSRARRHDGHTACTIPAHLYDLVAPKENAQKPAGEWNHMTITARGPKMTVTLNDKEVSTINLDEWNEPGKRPDGSSHKFDNVAIGKLPRTGYFGFQDHGSDCWFKNVKIKELD